jgi:uncharacterized membrane protein YqhA
MTSGSMQPQPERGYSSHQTVRRLIGWSRYFIIVDVIGLFAAFMALMISSVYSTFFYIFKALVDNDISQKALVGKLVQQADTALLATVLYVIALGLYSLFIDDSIPMPHWLRIRSLTDLKELLASVVIVVLAVVFLGFALTWDFQVNLLVPGLSIGAVIAALAGFLWVTSNERTRREQLEVEREEIERCEPRRSRRFERRLDGGLSDDGD